jgi:hypothetical protein
MAPYSVRVKKKPNRSSKHSVEHAPSLDCSQIGCVPEGGDKLSPWLGAWNIYEKNHNGKIWIFEIFCDGCRIQYRQSPKGAKSRVVDVYCDSEELTNKKFHAMINEKEQEGYRLINVKI